MKPKWDKQDCGCVKANLSAGRVMIRCSRHRGKPSKASLIRKLRSTRERIARLDLQREVARRERDDLALELIENHELTWRETAELAGFENPYIARILRRARSA